MGKIIEVYGMESTGKTTLATQVIASFQRSGLPCALIDVERTYIADYGAKLGVDNSSLVLANPLFAEQAFEIIGSLIQHGTKLIVVDSVAALLPKEEAVSDSNALGLQARILNREIRKIIPMMTKLKSTVLFINQLRKNVSTGPFMVVPETTTGGLALKFFTSIRLELKRVGYIRRGTDETVGAEIRVKSVKNKLHKPMLSTVLYLYNGSGFSVARDLLVLGEGMGLVEHKGLWFELLGQKLGPGIEKALSALQPLVETLRTKVLEQRADKLPSE